MYWLARVETPLYPTNKRFIFIIIPMGLSVATWRIQFPYITVDVYLPKSLNIILDVGRPQ